MSKLQGAGPPAGILEQAAHYGRELLVLLRTTWTEYERDNGRYLAGAMVYYALVSLVPLLLLLLAALGLLLRFSTFAAEARAQVLRTVEASFGTELRMTIEQLLVTLQQESIVATVVSLVGLLLTASVLFRHLRLSFRAIWKYEPPMVSGPVRVALWATFLEQAMAFVMVLLGGVLLLAVMVLFAATRWLNSLLSGLPITSQVTAWLLAELSPLTVALIIFALLFKYLPPVRMRWRDVALASVLCALAWYVGGQALALYGAIFGSSGSAFGAVGALLAIMLWMNIISQVLFFGAELCKVVATRGEAGQARA